MKRRDFLRVAGGSTAVGTAAATATPAAAQASFDGWMSDVGNYSEVADATGQDEVTITVGAQGNGGNFAFDPPAVQVDPGTTVVWEWNGEGGQHNVVAEEGGEFESELTAEAGFTFEQTLESEGVVKYFCQPHRALGMKGVVVVGAMPGGGGEGGGGGGGGGGEVDLHELGVPIQAHWVGAATILGIIVSLIFSFYVLKYGESPHTGTGRGE
ncbi:halocyanin domain-containing protein [Haloplanus rubicundus]|uniref:Halocyanin domain-containing protein n=1 Tax=Haloplanus rubicundus TaxID=1547898 RepID=A0A345E367_9EURY|nr:halocyanin domain-containing protein [Haloplanus rubicundus]AXG06639.1 halocyanin domain-containing protein [Haloplanus rubicundus]AXG10014.1 halocyanin domain-containing protein [Haloplanus rubicundus]